MVNKISSVRPRTDPASGAGRASSARMSAAVSFKIPPRPASSTPAGQAFFSSPLPVSAAGVATTKSGNGTGEGQIATKYSQIPRPALTCAEGFIYSVL